MQCPRCGSVMVQASKGRLCEACEGEWSDEQMALLEALEGLDLSRIPSFIAVPLHEWSQERNPVQRLWRLCDAVEGQLRYLACAGLAERLRNHGGRLPSELARRLVGRLDRPTFGIWLEVAREVCLRAQPPLTFVPEAPQAVSEIEALLGSGDIAETSLLATRNRLAHGGAISSSQALALLAAHQVRTLELFVAQQRWMARYTALFIPKEGEILDLTGLCIETWAGARLPGAPLARLSEFVDRVVMLGPCEDSQPQEDCKILNLWPVFDLSVPEVLQSCGTSTPPAPGIPMFFMRANPNCLVFIPLGGDINAIHRNGKALSEFWNLFADRPRRPQEDFEDFSDEVREEAERRSGREAELKLVVDSVVANRSGVFWAGGKPGIGKSMLMASVACHSALCSEPQKILTIIHCFRTGDERCSLDAFLRLAVRRLESWKLLAARTKAEASGSLPPQALRKRFADLLEQVGALAADAKKNAARVVFILDGMDEIARVDRRVLDLPFTTRHPNVLWLCAGRLEGDEVSRFRQRPGVQDLFPHGLPPLGPDDIRAMLEAETGPWRYAVLDEDREEDGLVRNQFIEIVADRSEGYPIYVRHVVEELASGRIDLKHPNSLPTSLAQFYQELHSRLGVGELQQILTPVVVTLAVSQEPLGKPQLFELLVHRTLLEPDAGHEILDRALETVDSMLRSSLGRDGSRRFSIYHNTFREALVESPATAGAAKTAVRALARATLDWAKDELSATRPYLLKYGAGHLLDVGLLDDAVELLTDIEFVERMCGEGGPRGLVEAYAKAAVELGREHPEWDLMDLLGEAVSLDSQFLAVRPEQFFQTMWNRCWWYGAPDTASHYDEPGFAPSRQPGGEKLNLLMNSWRARKEQGRPFVWLRSLRPPDQHLGTGQRCVLRGHEDAVTCLALCGDTVVSGSTDHSVRIWDLQSCRLLRTLEVSGPVSAVAAMRDAQGELCVACGDEYGVVHLWDPVTVDHVEAHETGGGGVNALKLGPDGRSLYSVLTGGSVMKMEVDGDGFCVDDDDEVAWCLCVSPDGHTLVTGSSDGTVRLRDARAGRTLHVLRGHVNGVNCVAFSPDGRTVVSGSSDSSVRVWDAMDGRLLGSFGGEEAGVRAVAFSPSGRRVATGSSDGTIRFWDVQLGLELRVVKGHGDCITDLAFTADGRHVVTCSGSESQTGDNSIRVWDANRGRVLRPLRGHEEFVTSLVFCPDGKRFYSAADDGVRVWDPETGDSRQILELGGTLAASSESRYLCVAGERGALLEDLGFLSRLMAGRRGGAVDMWDVEEERHLWKREDCGAGSVAFSPDGRRVACGPDGCSFRSDGAVRVRCAETGRDLWVQEEAGCTCLAFSPDGRWVLSGSRDGTLRLWDAETGLLEREMKSAGGTNELGGVEVSHVAFSPDGRQALSAARTTVSLWDVDTGKHLRLFTGYEFKAGGVSFSREGGRLISSSLAFCGSGNDTVRFADAEAGQCLKTLEGRTKIPQPGLSSPETHRWLPLARVGETAIVEWPTGGEVAHLALCLEHAQVSPTDPRLIVGTRASHVAMFVVEGPSSTGQAGDP